MRQLIRNGCCCYHKGTYFQANHNRILSEPKDFTLLLLPQRYVFSSKSQLLVNNSSAKLVVVATTKVRIFKQITTKVINYVHSFQLLLLPQRYVFSSKSQQLINSHGIGYGCCCYHKGTYFQANHNTSRQCKYTFNVVVATTKVRIFKQITTFFSL